MARKVSLEDEYFDELYELVLGDRYKTYYGICKLLHEYEFEWQIDMDRNRWKDGISYRERLGYDNVKDGCSVFEMMVALSVRIEEDIMDDPSYGSRIHQWFWRMFTNMGLSSYDDNHFGHNDILKAREIIERFIYRDYDSSGKGNLFKFRYSTPIDIRDVEIWMQMSWYINENNL